MAGFSEALPAWFGPYLGVEACVSVVRCFDLQFACGGTFTILRFTERDVADVVYVEQLTGATYVDKPDAVDYHRDVMNRLASPRWPRPPR